MQIGGWRASIALAALMLMACGGGGSSGTSGGSGGGGSGGGEAACGLIDDAGGPGQYSDSCVTRAWAEPYVGVYTSPNCVLTISTPSGGPPAVFELVVTDAVLGGTYTHDWEGGSGAGNDSYYRFTTDASFTTTKAINFAAARNESDVEERSIRFRINDLDTGTPSFTGGFSKTISSPFSNEEMDCGVLTPKP